MLITPRSWVRPSHGPWTVQFRFFCSSFQGTFEFNFWSERSFAELSWKWVQIALICCAVIFGSFAGAGAHHQGLRRLKPCQFQRTVYWHCECDKLCPNARFRATDGQFVVHGQGAVKQMGLVSPGFNLHLWKFHRRWKVPGQLLVRDSSLVRDLYENSKWFGGRLSRSKICQISQGAMGSDSCCLAAWLRLLIKRELIELLFAFFFFFFCTLPIYVGSRTSVLECLRSE